MGGLGAVPGALHWTYTTPFPPGMTVIALRPLLLNRSCDDYVFTVTHFLEQEQ